jgi:cytochrome c peroxidase
VILALAVACSSPSRSGEPRAAATSHGDSGSDVAPPRGAAPDGGTATPALPWDPAPFPAAVAPAENPTTAEKVALGRLLFYDPIVSADGQVACATCHSEVWGMSDGLPRSVGQGAGLVSGPGRSGSNVTRRNAPTLWNAVYKKSVFWDGRAASLEEQVHFPFDAAEEFDAKLDDVVAKVGAVPKYADLFRAAFPDEPEPVTPTTFGRAIAAFERSLVSNASLYDSYVEGDTGALSPPMLHGMALFASEGCIGCHAPPLFTSDRFVDRGVPPVAGVPDQGRYEVTEDEVDRNAFAVPTLRNAHDTGPYFHTGAVEDFGEAVRRELAFSVEHDGAAALSDADTADLATFVMKGLFDSQDSPTRPREVPSGLPVPIDGFSIRR